MNIGHACKLLESSMNMFIMQSVQLDEIKDQLSQFKEQQS